MKVVAKQQYKLLKNSCAVVFVTADCCNLLNSYGRKTISYAY